MLLMKLLGIFPLAVRGAWAALRRLRRPGKKLGILLAGLAVVAAAALVWVWIEYHTGRREVGRTTYRSHDGTYSVEVIKYSDGTREERRIDEKNKE
jgi:hypothetical protein